MGNQLGKAEDWRLEVGVKVAQNRSGEREEEKADQECGLRGGGGKDPVWSREAVGACGNRGAKGSKE